MYRFLDLRTRVFLGPTFPDEGDAAAQRSTLEKKFPSVYEANKGHVIGLVHMDDKTDFVDWQSPIILGPKGGAAVIEDAPANTKEKKRSIREIHAKIPSSMCGLTNDFKSKIADLHRVLARDISAIQKEYEAKISAILKRIPNEANILISQYETKVCDVYRLLEKEAVEFEKSQNRPDTTTAQTGYTQNGKFISPKK